MQLDKLALDGRLNNTPEEEMKVANHFVVAYEVGKRLLRHKGKRLLTYVVLEPNVIVPEYLAADMEDHYEVYQLRMAGLPMMDAEQKSWLTEWTTERDRLLKRMDEENIAK